MKTPPKKSRYQVYRERKAEELQALKTKVKDLSDETRRLHNERIAMENELTLCKHEQRIMKKWTNDEITDLHGIHDNLYKRIRAAEADVEEKSKLVAKAKRNALISYIIYLVAIIGVTIAFEVSKHETTKEAERWERNAKALKQSLDRIPEQEQWSSEVPPDTIPLQVLTRGYLQDGVWKSYDTGQPITVTKWKR